MCVCAVVCWLSRVSVSVCVFARARTLPSSPAMGVRTLSVRDMSARANVPRGVDLLCQVVAVNRHADKRVMKVLVDWPEGDEMTSTTRGERMTSTIDVLLYLEGVASVVTLRHNVAIKSTAKGTLASIKRALAVRAM